MGVRYISDENERRAILLGVENLGDYVNEAVREKLDKDERKAKK